MFATILATVLSLSNGLNPCNAAGEIVSFDCLTADATPTVALKAVDTVSEFTNAQKTVITPFDVYTVISTNYPHGGNAGYATTNVFTNVVDWGAALWTNYDARVSLDIANLAATNVVDTDTALVKNSYTITNDIFSVTCSGHYGSDTTTGKFVVGRGKLLVTGAKRHDRITIIVK